MDTAPIANVPASFCLGEEIIVYPQPLGSCQPLGAEEGRWMGPAPWSVCCEGHRLKHVLSPSSGQTRQTP